MCQFGQKRTQDTTSSTTADMTTSNQSQGLNIFGGQLQNAGNNFFDAFSGQDPANSWMINAANQQQDPSTLGGYQSAANTIAQQGNDPGKTGQWMSPYIQNVINPTLAAQNLQNKQALSNLAGNQAVRGALGNNTGSAAAYLAGVQPAQQAQIGQLYQTGFTGAQAAQDASSKAQLGAIGTGQQGATAGNLALGQLGQNIQGGWQTFLGGLQNLLAPYGQEATGHNEGTGQSHESGKTTALGGNVAAALLSLGLKGASLLADGGRVGMKPYARGGAVNGGLSFHDKVRAAHGALTEMRNGGGRVHRDIGGGTFLDGLSPGLGKMASGLGDEFSNMSKLGMPQQGQGQQNQQQADQGQGALARALAALMTPYQPRNDAGAVATAGPGAMGAWQPPFASGGLVGYQEGGSPVHAFAGNPTRALQGFFNALDASELSDDKLGNDAPMVPFGPPVPTQPVPGTADWNLGREVQIGLPEGQTILTPSNSLPDLPSTGLEAAGLSPFHGTHHLPYVPDYNFGMFNGADEAVPSEAGVGGGGELNPSALTPNVLRPFGREPVGTTADITGRMNPPPADNLGPGPHAPPAVGKRGQGALTNWAQENIPGGIQDWWSRINTARPGRLLSPLEDFGHSLGNMAGPLIGNPWGHTIPAATAGIQARTLENNIAHQNAVLAATLEHNRTMEVPDVVRQLRAAGIDPTSAEGQRIIREHLNRDRTEAAYDQGIARASVADLEARQTAINGSNTRLQNLSQMESLLNRPGVPQGRFANWELEGRRIAQALGFNVQGVGEAEAFRTLAGQMALELRSTGAGAGMPGAMSDQDRAFLERMTPALERTPQGNALIIRMMREMEQYRIASNTEAQRFIRAGRSNVGLSEHMTAWHQANPMATVVPTVQQTREQATALVTPQAAAGAGHVGDASLPTMTAAEAQAAGVQRFRGTDGIIYSAPPQHNTPDGLPLYNN